MLDDFSYTTVTLQIYIFRRKNMLRKLIFIVLAIVLVGGIGIALIHEEQKNEIGTTVSDKFNNTRRES